MLKGKQFDFLIRIEELEGRCQNLEKERLAKNSEIERMIKSHAAEVKSLNNQWTSQIQERDKAVESLQNSILDKTNQENLVKLENGKKLGTDQERVIKNLKSSRQKALDDLKGREEELEKAKQAAKELQECHSDLYVDYTELMVKLEAQLKKTQQVRIEQDQALQKASDELHGKAMELTTANQTAVELRERISDLEKALKETLAKLLAKEQMLEKTRKVRIEQDQVLQKASDELQGKAIELTMANQMALELQERNSDLERALEETLSKLAEKALELEKANKLGAEQDHAIQNLQKAQQTTSDELAKANQVAQDLLEQNSSLAKAQLETTSKLATIAEELQKSQKFGQELCEKLAKAEADLSSSKAEKLATLQELKGANQSVEELQLQIQQVQLKFVD